MERVVGGGGAWGKVHSWETADKFLSLEITLLNSLRQKKNNALNCTLDKMSIFFFLAQQTNPNCF